MKKQYESFSFRPNKDINNMLIAMNILDKRSMRSKKNFNMNKFINYLIRKEFETRCDNTNISGTYYDIKRWMIAEQIIDLNKQLDEINIEAKEIKEESKVI